ncbi:hypothetical protein GJQ54_11080 [Oceanospirillaceae bacterium ASx5O]|nr:hypothetical protein GJQ54_11080 [Oceanospirillaceae bacterium ASx5O]
MIGFPKTLQTAADFNRCHSYALAGELSKEKMAAAWQMLLTTAYAWQISEKTEAEAAGDPLCKVMPGQEENEPAQVFEKVRVAGAEIDQLGFTETEVAEKITELEAQ